MMLTSIPITSLETGGTEQQTQVVIDLLQAKGWRVYWGTGVWAFCSDSERLAFKADLRQAVSEIQSEYEPDDTNFDVWPDRGGANFDGTWPSGHCPPPLRDGGTAGESVAAKFRV